MWYRRIASALACLSLLSVLTAWAQNRTAVSQSFRVRVTNNGQPKAGILVNVQQGRPPQIGPAIRSEVTDRNGEVSFQGVPPGDFTVRTAEWDRNDAVVISVKRGGATSQAVSLRWPNLAMQRVRELRGTIHERQVRITAFQLQSGEQVGSTLTDDSGRFAFPSARRGEYLLRLYEEGPKTSLHVHGDIGVSVDKSAPGAEVDLFLEMQGGRLSYGSFCHLPLNFKVTHLCGQVTDEHGAVLPNIRVSYRDSRGGRHSAITDASGLFDVKDSSPAETFLEITGPGYIPLRATGLRKGTDPSCQRRMRITLPKEETGYGCRSVRGID